MSSRCLCVEAPAPRLPPWRFCDELARWHMAARGVCSTVNRCSCKVVRASRLVLAASEALEASCRRADGRTSPSACSKRVLQIAKTKASDFGTASNGLCKTLTRFPQSRCFAATCRRPSAQALRSCVNGCRRGPRTRQGPSPDAPRRFAPEVAPDLTGASVARAPHPCRGASAGRDGVRLPRLGLSAQPPCDGREDASEGAWSDAPSGPRMRFCKERICIALTPYKHLGSALTWPLRGKRRPRPIVFATNATRPKADSQETHFSSVRAIRAEFRARQKNAAPQMRRVLRGLRPSTGWGGACRRPCGSLRSSVARSRAVSRALLSRTRRDAPQPFRSARFGTDGCIRHYLRGLDW